MADPLEQAKALRNAAHDAFQLQLAQVQEDLTARGIGGRIADSAGEVIAEGIEVAKDHKGVVAGTIAALGIWVLRGPIINLLGRLLPDGEETERNTDD